MRKTTCVWKRAGRRFWILLAITIAICSPRGVVRAEDATGAGATAIKNRLAALSTAVKSLYFVQPITPKPQWLVPNVAAAQGFLGGGYSMTGLIIWSNTTGAHAIYGDVLDHWNLNGITFGAPLDEFHTAGAFEKQMCGSEVRKVQEFSQGWYICWYGAGLPVQHVPSFT